MAYLRRIRHETHTHDGRAAGKRQCAASGESEAPALSRYAGWAVAAARGSYRPAGRRSRYQLAVGLANDPSTGSAGFALARYHPNGTLDTTFGGDGRVITDFGGYTLAYAVALQPDGKIVVAGYAFDPFDPPIGLRTGFALARYQPNGTLDMTFGDDGLVITDVRNAAIIYAVALQPDGIIVVAGQA